MPCLRCIEVQRCTTAVVCCHEFFARTDIKAALQKQMHFQTGADAYDGPWPDAIRNIDHKDLLWHDWHVTLALLQAQTAT